MGTIVGWVIAALCGALFVVLVFASFFIAVLSMRRPPTAGRP